MEPPPKTIDVEVVREAADAGAEDSARTTVGPPIHPLAALLLVVIDNLWMIEEWLLISWIITIPLSFLTVCLPTYFVQRHLKKDRPGRALAFAVAMGTVAAVPFSVLGTPVGLSLLAWTGLRHWFPPTFPNPPR